MEQNQQAQMLKLFGEYRTELDAMRWLDIETKRNIDNIDLFEAMIREAYDGVTTVVAGHHIMFLRDGHPVPYEIASADTLIFDHGVAGRIWKESSISVLALLAAESPAGRDALLRKLYFGRGIQLKAG